MEDGRVPVFHFIAFDWFLENREDQTNVTHPVTSPSIINDSICIIHLLTVAKKMNDEEVIQYVLYSTKFLNYLFS